MAYTTKAESDLRLHEFFDRIKKRAFDWIAAGNEFWCKDENGDEVVIRFSKKPEPKTYTFAEAFAMMNAERWMKLKDRSWAFSNILGVWMHKSLPNGRPSIINNERSDIIMFTNKDIESQWVEVNS